MSQRKRSIVFIIQATLVVAVLLSATTFSKLPEVVEVPPPPPPVEVKYVISYPAPPSWVSRSYVAYVIQECARQNVPYLLVFKLIELESGWKASAKNVNKDPVTGEVLSIDWNRFQINSKNFTRFIALYKDPDRPASSYDLINDTFDNAQIGIRHLADLYREFGNWTQAIQAYNGGAPRVKNGTLLASTYDYQKYIIPIEGWWESPPNVVIIRKDVVS